MRRVQIVPRFSFVTFTIIIEQRLIHVILLIESLASGFHKGV